MINIIAVNLVIYLIYFRVISIFKTVSLLVIPALRLPMAWQAGIF